MADVCQICIDQVQSTAFGRGADGGVFCQGFSNPSILSIVCADDDYQIVSGGIVRVEKVRDYAQEAEAARKEDELIFLAEFFEYFLLELLYSCQLPRHPVRVLEPYQR